MVTYIGELVQDVPCISPNTHCSIVEKIFNNTPSLHGVVVTNQKVPISLITRSHFFQKLGSLYGYNLFIGKPVIYIMSTTPLIVDYLLPTIDVCHLAMNRDEGTLYDYVLVTKENEFMGVVSIRDLLIKFAEDQAEFAMGLNPLSGLPGNEMIESRLQSTLNMEHFSVLYIDLDHFKTYNDTYGFKRGDVLLQATAGLLKKSFTKSTFFLGHIGGDDFVAILDNYSYQSICLQIIDEFQQLQKSFYDKIHFQQKFITSKNRAGKIENIPLVSLSIAVVSNETKQFNTISEIVDEATKIKKICKLNPESCYYTN